MYHAVCDCATLQWVVTAVCSSRRFWPMRMLVTLRLAWPATTPLRNATRQFCVSSVRCVLQVAMKRRCCDWPGTNVRCCLFGCLFWQLSSVPEGRTYLGLQSDLLAQLLWKQVLMANASATQRANNALGIAADGVDDSGLASASRRWALVALQRLR